jgi:hypothetical protein
VLNYRGVKSNPVLFIERFGDEQARQAIVGLLQHFHDTKLNVVAFANVRAQTGERLSGKSKKQLEIFLELDGVS